MIPFLSAALVSREQVAKAAAWLARATRWLGVVELHPDPHTQAERDRRLREFEALRKECNALLGEERRHS